MAMDLRKDTRRVSMRRPGVIRRMEPQLAKKGQKRKERLTGESSRVPMNYRLGITSVPVNRKIQREKAFPDVIVYRALGGHLKSGQ